MSVKLYDAWRMPVMPMAKFQKWLNELRTTFHPIADKIILTECAYRAIRAYDLDCVFPNRKEVKENKMRSYLVSAWSKILTEYKEVKKTSHRNPAVDVECEIIFHFRGRFIYMVMFTEVHAYKDHLVSLPNIEDYGYWDNTDKPDYITQRAWNHRKKLWDDVFGYGQYLQAGLTWTLIGDYNLAIPNKGNVEEYFTPFNKRLSNMLDEAVIKYYPGEWGKHSIYNAYNWMKTDPAAKKIREEIKPKIEAMMKKELTFDDVNK